MLITKIYKPSEFNEAAKELRLGELVAFPTETVYGLGADATNEQAVKRVYLAKGRPSDNPLIVTVSSLEMVKRFVPSLSKEVEKIIEKFWPGSLTIVLKIKDGSLSKTVTGGLKTAAFRMPKNETTLNLITALGNPIVGPSANSSGKPSPTTAQHVYHDLEGRIAGILDDGPTDVGVESTIIDMSTEIPTILRPGKITPNDIEKIAGIVNIDKNVLNKIDINEKVLSPGMKYRHYAPKSKCVLVYSDSNNKLVNKIIEISKEYNNPLIISSTENKVKYNIKNIIDVGHNDNLMEIAKNIFTTLRKVDSYSPDLVIIEGVKEEGIGLAIMNRLIRACEYNYIKI